MIIEKEVIEALRKEAETSRVAREVFVEFGFRKRARSILTINGIDQAMRKKGFENKLEDYAKVLFFLDKVKLGKIMVKPDGTVIGLKDINISLESIGKAALNREDSLEGFRPRKKYQHLPLHKETPTPRQALLKPIQIAEHKPDVSIKVELSPGIRYEIAIPKDATLDQITSLIKRLM